MLPPRPLPFVIRVLPFTVEEDAVAAGWRRLTLAVEAERAGGATRYGGALFPERLVRAVRHEETHARWRAWVAWNLIREGLAAPVDEAVAGLRRVLIQPPSGRSVACSWRGSVGEWAHGVQAEYEALLLNDGLPSGSPSRPPARL